MFYKIARSQKGLQLICDYYVVHGKRSNFVYMAVENVNCYAFTRTYMCDEILDKFPSFEFHLKLSSLFYYNKLISKPLADFKKLHFEQ